jgi:Tol biopolymer transport system component
LRRALALAGLLTALVVPATAHATFPGANGKIAFVRGGDIWSMNADGTDQVQLTNTPQTEKTPMWSPDGSKIAFGVGPSDWQGKVYTMNADGTSQHLLSFGDTNDWSPAWSPDGTRVAFASQESANSVSVINADGTNRNRFAFVDGVLDHIDWSADGTSIAFDVGCVNYPGFNGFYLGKVEAKVGGAITGLTDANRCSDGFAPNDDTNPSWSPDVQRIAFDSVPPTSGTPFIYSIRPDGSDLTYISGTSNDPRGDPAWSPDGRKIVFEHPGGAGLDIATMNSDGTGTVDLAQGRYPDWQPIPINYYARPKGATPLRIALVTANDQCTSPNRAHGAPLAFPSCAPVQLSSGQLTVGTGDSNAKPALMQASIRLDAAPGDVKVAATLNDIFNKDLSDYTGALKASIPLQITDKNNTPSPAGPGAATSETLPLEFDIGCTPTADTSAGSDCALNTTLDTLVPGTVTAGKRAVWQLGQVKVYDGNGSLFAVEGVFVP